MTPGTRRVFLRDLILQARIGVYASEHGRTQRIRLDVDLDMDDPGGVGADELGRVLDYADLHGRIVAEVTSRHVRLVETLAERLAGLVLADKRVRRVRIRLAKLDILPDGASAGVEVERGVADLPTAADTS